MSDDSERKKIDKAKAISAALSEGRLPTTAQAVGAIHKVQESGVLQAAAKDMSVQGKKVMLDAEQLLEDAKKTLLAKNAGNEIQNIVHFATAAAKESKPAANTAAKSVRAGVKRAGEEIKDAAAESGKNLYEATGKAMDLARMVVTSSEFRSVVREIAGLVQEILKTNVQEATNELDASTSIPSKLQNAKQSITSSEPAQKASEAIGKAKEKAPELQNAAQGKAKEIAGKAKETSESVKEKAKDAAKKTKESAEPVKEKAKEGVEKVKESAGPAKEKAEKTLGKAKQTGKQLKDEVVNHRYSLRHAAHSAVDSVADTTEEVVPQVQEKASRAVQKAKRKASDVAEDLGLEVEVPSAGEVAKKAKTTAKQAKDKVAEVASGELPSAGEVIEKGKKVVGKVKKAAEEAGKVVSEVQESGGRVVSKLVELDESKKDEIIVKFKRIAQIVQKNPRYQKSLQDIFSLLGEVRDRARGVSDMVMDEANEAKDETMDSVEEVKGHVAKKARVAGLNAKQLVENFAGGRSIDGVLSALQELVEASVTESALYDLLQDLSDFLTSSFTDAKYTSSPKFTTIAKDLIATARDVFSSYTGAIMRLTWESYWFTKAVEADEGVERVQRDLKEIVRDLKEGGVQGVADVLQFIASCVEKLTFLPIPRIEVDDGTYQLILDDILLHATILPKYIRVVTDTTLDSTSGKIGASGSSAVYIEISNIEASARDVAWLYRKHSGMLKVGDVGYADFDMEDEGLTLKIQLSPGPAKAPIGEDESSGPTRTFDIEDVECEVKQLDLRLHDSGHDWLYAIARPLINSYAKAAIADAVVTGIKTILGKVDEKVADLVGGATGVTLEAQAREGIRQISEADRTKEGREWKSDAFSV
ncbi:hypothetical protein HDV00_011393 [Rhizophlyctis rosea]|nr:hypothetical protein HDV00_011393 [Rhizophlyctis rosea]